jgi:hypothetical protein
LQARLTSALLLPLSPVLKWHGQYQGLGTIPAVAGCPSPLGYDPQVPPYASKTLPSSSGITSMSHHARLIYCIILNCIKHQVLQMVHFIRKIPTLVYICIVKGLRMKNFGILCRFLEYFAVIWYIL